ncbi:hypothetical protein Calag_0929 [Caldisphaera lagunensis DSM 15908]|uniref:DUF4350 domain-containing protein n=1 Tax=Caldisphaera lagunensis (strain DSM 15908 / JCM 11604 / ANMR 0165 / IC-154) TaxID=1056495 RepID=L0AC97_CALLD|nr:hypothetical protein [Caldisphaera lagunensis]AFZ70660.1 hypothetical protein Calag_0929 [Caldisphaera lagunensis DSM 15908]
MISKLNIGLFISIFIIICLIIYFPTYQPFSPFNNAWDGFSLLYKNSSGIVDNPSQLSKINGILILPVQIKPNNLNLYYLNSFLNRGGTLIIVGNGSNVNYLLNGIGSSIYTYNYTVLDNVFNYNSPLFPLAIFNSSKIVLFSTSYLKNGNTLANTSFFSYIKLKNNVTYGPFSVISEQSIGKGEVIVISDQYFFTNYLIRINNHNNIELLKLKKYYIATFLLPQLPQYKMKLLILNISEIFNYPYVQVLIFALLFLISSIIYNIYPSSKEINYPKIADLIREHPDWDEKILRKILEERNNEA